ncbi:type 1 glutamine amidotransferase domain-containing protein [Flagellimonas sp. 2504JD1-5]
MKKTIQWLCIFILLGCQPSSKKQEGTGESVLDGIQQKRILFIVSNAHHYGDSEIECTNHFPEIIYAYEEFAKHGYAVDFVSPKGGEVAVGYIYSSDTITKKYLYDAEFMNQLQRTKAPHEIDYTTYNAVYYTGGGSAMFTVPYSKEIQTISMNVYEENKGVISAICHGTAGMANLKRTDGTYLVSGKKITGFPDLFEDKNADYYQEFPFSIQEQIIENGGDFKYSEEGWDGFYLQDGRIVTGQDPTGSGLVAQRVIEILENQNIN